MGLQTNGNARIMLSQTWLAQHQVEVDYKDKRLYLVQDGVAIEIACPHIGLAQANTVTFAQLNSTQLKRIARARHALLFTVTVFKFEEKTRQPVPRMVGDLDKEL